MEQKIKIAILGNTGMLGWVASKYLSDIFHVENFNRNNFNLKNKIEFEKLKNFDYVINCIGIIKPRIKNSLEEAVFVNTIFPLQMANYCEENNIKFIHITTDCVYSGKLKESLSYNENDKHDAEDEYGKTKSLGEPSNALTIRTSIMGPEKAGFYSFLEWLRKNKNNKIKGFKNHFWNGVTTLELSKALEFIIKNNLFKKDKIHIYTKLIETKFSMCQKINNIYNLNLEIEEVLADGGSVNRSLISIKDSLYRVNSFEEQLKQLKQFEMGERE